MAGENQSAMPQFHGKTVVLYDGVCGLCNNFNKLVLKHAKSDDFAFASLQSDFARKELNAFGLDPTDLDTIYVIPELGSASSRPLRKSSAALHVMRRLKQPIAFLAAVMSLLPLKLRDWGYDMVARNRYRFFGKYDTCLMPGSKEADKFIEV